MASDTFDPRAAARHLAVALGAPAQPQPLYEASDALAAELLGHRLFTILAFRPESGEVERMYTSRPQEYPLLGRKPMGPTPWGAHVLEGGNPWFGADADAIRWAFPDHELILSLGCESILNAPVRYDGRTLGVVSVLDGAGAYTEADLEIVTFLAPYLVPALTCANGTGPQES